MQRGKKEEMKQWKKEGGENEWSEGGGRGKGGGETGVKIWLVTQVYEYFNLE